MKIRKNTRILNSFVSTKKRLRKVAFKSLNSFINETKDWDGNKKKEFVNWLFGWIEKSENIHHVLVYPLEENLLKPILKEWMDDDSKDPKLFRWYGIFLKDENNLRSLISGECSSWGGDKKS